MQAFNHTRQRSLAETGTVAIRPWARMRGLLGRSALQANEGLLLLGTRGIHMIGMRFAIDVLFLNEDGWVIRLIHSLKPFRISPIVKNSAMVLELPTGILAQTGTQVGDWIGLTLTDLSTRQTIRKILSVQEPQ